MPTHRPLFCPCLADHRSHPTSTKPMNSCVLNLIFINFLSFFQLRKNENDWQCLIVGSLSNSNTSAARCHSWYCCLAIASHSSRQHTLCLAIHSTIAIAYRNMAASLQSPFAMHRITAISFRGLPEHLGCFCNSLDCCHLFSVSRKHRSCTRNFSDLCSRSHGLQNDRNHTCDLRDLRNGFCDLRQHRGCFSQVSRSS